METLRNEPVSFGTPTGGGSSPVVVNTPASGGGYGDNGLLSTILIASMLGGRGFGNYGNNGTCEPSATHAFAQRAADNSSQLLSTVTKAEGDIKEAFSAGQHRAQIEQAGHFTALFNRSCEVEKEAMKSGYEARLEALQTKSDILANQNQNTISIKDDIKDFRFETAKNFCDTNNLITSKFCDLDHTLDKQFRGIENLIQDGFRSIGERELKQENARLRDKLDSIRYNEERRDLTEIRKDVDRVLCGLSKVPSPNGVVPSILDGCCS